MNKSETFVFDKVPTSVDELKALSECDLASPFKTCALTMLVLMNYRNNVEQTVEMLNVLKGPDPMSQYDLQFLKERLSGKEYLPASYFEGSSPENNYVPSCPYTITVSDNPYSYTNEGWAVLYVASSGADSPRSIKCRLKPSTGQWFMVDNMALVGIRVPKEEDPWA